MGITVITLQGYNNLLLLDLENKFGRAHIGSIILHNICADNLAIIGHYPQELQEATNTSELYYRSDRYVFREHLFNLKGGGGCGAMVFFGKKQNYVYMVDKLSVSDMGRKNILKALDV